MYKRLFCILLFAAFVCTADDVDDARKLLSNSRTRRRGVLELYKLARSRDDAVAVRAIAVLAPDMRTESPRKLEKLLKDYAEPTKKNAAYPRVEGFAENARLVGFQGDRKGAVDLLNKGWDKAESVLAQCVVEEAWGDIAQMDKGWKKALGNYVSALGRGERHYKRTRVSATAKMDPPKPGHKQWQVVKARIKRKRKGVERQLRIEKLGLDYVLYEEARLAHSKGDLKDALTRYGDLRAACPKSIYAEAASFFMCFCVEEGKNPSATFKALEEFRKRDPAGLYRGEAMYSMAEIKIREEYAPEDAAKLYAAAVDWCVKRRREGTSTIKLRVPKKSREVSAPPGEAGEQRESGRVVYNRVPPQKLLNRLTSKWYLNDLEKQARFGTAFCLMTDRKWKEADAELDRTLKLDPLMANAFKKQLPSDYTRLKLACRYHKIIAVDEELKRLDRRLRTGVMYGDFLYLCGRFDESAKHYRKVVKLAEKKKNAPAIVLAKCSLSDVMVMVPDGPLEYEKEHAASDKILLDLIKRYPKEPNTARAYFFLGNSEDDEKKCAAYYETGARIQPNGYYGLSCLLMSIHPHLKSGRVAEARKIANKLLNNSKWRELAKGAGYPDPEKIFILLFKDYGHNWKEGK